MPMDGVTLYHISRELNALLSGGRVDKIVQPERDEVLITVRANGSNHTLLLSASAGCARAHITTIKKNNPLEPPMLCMLMRKHISGGRVKRVRQADADRILEIEFEHINELGDLSVKTLICEFMGKHSNLILTDANGRIMESARRVTEAISSVREVLPGLLYRRPPAHGKLPFDAFTAQELRARLDGARGMASRAFSEAVSGLSPALSREIAHRVLGDETAYLEGEDVADAVRGALNQMLLETRPMLIKDENGESCDFTAFPYLSRAHLESVPFATLSMAMDEFYASRDSAERVKQKSSALHRALKGNIERCEKKLALQDEAIAESARMEEFRIKGELLTASPQAIRKGAKSVSMPNYYDENCAPLSIELDERIGPAANAQRYFKLYRKAHGARKTACEQKEKTADELSYLESAMESLRKCTEESELQELRDELTALGYVRDTRTRRQKKQLPPSKPLHIVTDDGFDILIGKNNLQNDKLTFSAQPDEYWLHAKDVPASHVILASANPSTAALLRAARLAAKYSKACASKTVSVDYTLRKYVKKPAGAKPGFVIYTHQKTLTVEPEA